MSECMQHGWREEGRVCPFCMVLVLKEDIDQLKAENESYKEAMENQGKAQYACLCRAEKAEAENKAQLAELTAISDALGTREGHSSVSHIEALKAEVKRFREEFEKICSKVIDSPYIYAGKNYTLHDLRHGVEQALKASE